jgi:DNA polymerase-3 subunit gamma/tau
MLTKEAFNALLKTLEEPPAHVIFILATTEKDKLLDTITSRCQVFEFRAPSRAELRDAILAVAQHEKFKLGSPGADVIALVADGSYRDAFGITQKVMLASDDAELSTNEIAEIVGAPKTVVLNELLIAFGTKDCERGLDALKSASVSCIDPMLLYTIFLERIRAVILRHNKKMEHSYKEQFDSETNACIEAYAKDNASPIHSHLLMRFLEIGSYMGRNNAGFLPLEVVLLEHCSK